MTAQAVPPPRPYHAPIGEMMFALEHLAGLDHVLGLPGYEDLDAETVQAVLDEAGRFASEVIAPVDRAGDAAGSRLENGVVRTAPGFADAYRAFAEAGWNGVIAPPEHGGQGLPLVLGACLEEMWQGASPAFANCPMLTKSGIGMLAAYGTPAQQAKWLPRLVSGEWTGTMLLTEPQAGSDLSLIRSRAVKNGGGYRIFGEKIFATWGDHDMAENIVHMVLARGEGGPAGTRGLSLFIVPKRLVADDGSLGAANDVVCARLEDKMGLHGSPTAALRFGDRGEGAAGDIVGREGDGLTLMFNMMNSARLSVGVQGVAAAERALQCASAFAAERLQGRDIVTGEGPVAIARHPDVRRMLMTIRAGVEAARALALVAAAALDRSKRAPDAAQRDAAASRAALLTPVVKGWGTELGVRATSLAIQVHGGMGYIEETGAAQLLRDARIAPIYEGTNGIQALDLVRRKLAGDSGEEARHMIAEMRETLAALGGAEGAEEAALRRRLAPAVEALDTATGWMAKAAEGAPEDAAAGASPYLELFGIVSGGDLMARAALAARRALADAPHDRLLRNKLATAHFYAESFLAAAPGLAETATAGRHALGDIETE